MGISIEHAIRRRRKLQTVETAFLKRGWSISSYSPGTSLNGHVLDKWTVIASHQEDGRAVKATGATEEGARMDASSKAYKCESAKNPTFGDILNEPAQ
jgi:hypothetical protein